MSPADLGVLIHYHCIPEPHPRFAEEWVQSLTEAWVKEGILEETMGTVFDPTALPVFSTTERGQKWMEMILSTPQPEQIWIDPRDNK